MGTAPLHSQGDPSGACFCYAAHSQAQPPREWQGWSQSPGREPLSVAPRPPTPAATPGAGILEKGTGSERCFPPWVRTGPAGPPLCDDSATGATLRPSITLGGAKLSRDLEGHTPRPRLGPLADGGPPQRTGQTLPVTRPPSHAGAPCEVTASVGCVPRAARPLSAPFRNVANCEHFGSPGQGKG